MDDDYFTQDDEERDPYGTAAPEDPALEDDTEYVGQQGDYASSDPDVDITDGVEEKPPKNVRKPPGSTGRRSQTAEPSTSTPERLERRAADSTQDWKLEKVILVAVPEATDYLAAAKAAAQLTLRKRGDRSERLPRQAQPYRFVYDLPEEPAKTLTDEWGELPDAAIAEGEVGSTLLETAIEKTWGEDGQSPPEKSHIYNSDGEPITDRSTIDQLQETAEASGNNLFLVPALQLRPDTSKTVAEKEAERKRERINKASTRELMPCWKCGGLQEFSFDGYDGVPSPTTDSHDEEGGEDDEQRGSPVWSCTNCGAGKHGPDPNAH